MRRTLIICLVLWFRITLILSKVTKGPPNIVMIMADDMGLDDVSFRGLSEYLTPNIDALAYHGKILNHYYTPPMCTPSRSALLSGLYPIRTGSQHRVLLNEEPWSILENFTTIAEVLQANGYSTHLIGKWHLGMGRKEFTPTYKGFDTHYGYWGGVIDYFRMRSKIVISDFSMGYDFRRNMNLECAPPGSYVTDLFSEEAERVILNSKEGQPLFLLVSHLATHAANDDEPLQAPQEEIDKFAYIPDINRRTYAAMAAKLDESVGRIVKALDKSQKLDNTIIIFYSDNGAPSLGLYNNTGSNWLLRGQKESPWEGGIRVAGAIWSPLLKNKASIFQPTMYVADWFPTLAAAANISLQPFNLNLDGINLWPDLVTSKSTTLVTKNSEREILHMLDDIFDVKSYMKGQFKYIKGTTNNGQYDYVLLPRNPNVTDSREQNYTQIIRNSKVSLALQKFDDSHLTATKIQNLRQQANIQCGVLQKPCNPLQEECLFNVWQDPCEENNLAKHPLYANILNDMRNRVKELQELQATPCTGGQDPNYDPSRHNCAWTNYLDDPLSDAILECNYNSPPCQAGVETVTQQS